MSDLLPHVVDDQLETAVSVRLRNDLPISMDADVPSSDLPQNDMDVDMDAVPHGLTSSGLIASCAQVDDVPHKLIDCDACLKKSEAIIFGGLPEATRQGALDLLRDLDTAGPEGLSKSVCLAVVRS